MRLPVANKVGQDQFVAARLVKASMLARQRLFN
jgi:hypothetical protein